MMPCSKEDTLDLCDTQLEQLNCSNLGSINLFIALIDSSYRLVK